MYIEFKTLRFKNILSFGNSITEINMKNGLNLIQGSNGSGKSTCITDALCFCLYGKPYRKIKIKELINNRNKKGLYTEIDFSIGKNKYTIKRGMSPNKMEIIKNDSPMELLSSKGLVQEEIDKILGIDYSLFKQIISLSINNNVAFLKLSIDEKRKIIDSIFNIKIFGLMLKELKNNIIGIKSKLSIQETNISNTKEMISLLKNQIDNYNKSKKNFESDKLKEIESKEKTLKETKKKIESIDKEIKILEKKVKEPNSELIKKLENNTALCKTKLTEYKYELNQNDKNQKNFDILDVCPTCNNVISKEYKNIELDKLKKRYDKLKGMIDSVQKKYDELVDKLEKEKDLETEYKNTNNSISKYNFNKESKNKYLNSLKSDIENIKNKKFNLELNDVETKLDNKKKEYKELVNEFDELKNTKEKSNILKDILSDNGIKSFFLKKLTPIFNNKINTYIEKFDLLLSLEFNELMEEKLISYEYGKNIDINYYSLSEGEKKRVDMAILFSFIDMMKTICNWDCNILIMDELLDSSIDEDGLEKLLNNIFEIINTSKNNLSSFIISHRMIDTSYFKNVYNVHKAENGFSKIKEIEK